MTAARVLRVVELLVAGGCFFYVGRELLACWRVRRAARPSPRELVRLQAPPPCTDENPCGWCRADSWCGRRPS